MALRSTAKQMADMIQNSLCNLTKQMYLLRKRGIRLEPFLHCAIGDFDFFIGTNAV
jgi:hypothetical protein